MTNPRLEPGGDERLHMWQNNEAIVMHRLNSEQVAPDDVVVLVDTTCDVGVAVMTALAGSGNLPQDTIDSLTKIAATNVMIPTLVLLLKREMAIALTEIATPRVAETLRTTTLPPTHIFAMVIASGGTLLLAPKRTKPTTTTTNERPS